MSKRTNSDNENTSTIYIDPRERAAYAERMNSRRTESRPAAPQQRTSAPREYYRQPDAPGYREGYGQPYHRPSTDNRGEYGQPARPYRDEYREPPRRQSAAPPPKKKKRKRKKPLIWRILTRILLVLIILFLIIFGVYSCASLSLIKKLEYVESGDRNRTGGAISRSYVTNVLLIGSDSRGGERGRSDTMMLVSINKRTDEITLTSFMRDCYVDIPEYGWDKLNASYSYGGADLVMDTIEANFGIKIDNYAAVDFVSFANIVDAVGGIEIDVSEAEIREINTILQAEVNGLMGDDALDDLLDVDDDGKIKLNGKQALSYARIRYVGNADFERTERQRKVIEMIFNKVKDIGPSVISQVSDEVLPNVTTNMTTGELYMLSLRVPFLFGYDIQKLQVPAENSFHGDSTPSGDALIIDDFDANYYMLKDEVFDD
ncbi:MAG: LCP family protein [Ruminococcus sp.]|nr:LCP family protein [Ruminococcus sp.]